MERYYTSNAKWPSEIKLFVEDNITTDKHDSIGAAECVCAALQRDGFGGQGKVFPVRTWVDSKCHYEHSGWCKFTGKCKHQIENDDGPCGCYEAL